MSVLFSGPRHGYDLKHDHDELFAGAKPLAFGQVYATLERLLKAQRVEVVDIERVDGPERKVFALTDVGREELDRWLAETVPPQPHVSNPLALKATIALLIGDQDQAQAYLANQRQAHLDRMRYYTRIKTDPSTGIAEVLAADYALAHLDADLQWLDLALDRITQLAESISAAAPVSASSSSSSTSTSRQEKPHQPESGTP